MGDELEALDPAYVADMLSKPPFVSIPGVSNVRDLGSYPSTTPNVITKPGYAYRAAEISSITEEGVQMNSREKHPRTMLKTSFVGAERMRALRITTVFDLRSDPEMKKYSAPVPTIEGVQIVPAPVFRTEDYSPESIAKCVCTANLAIP